MLQEQIKKTATARQLKARGQDGQNSSFTHFILSDPRLSVFISGCFFPSSL
jgi:hypothetical protein